MILINLLPHREAARERRKREFNVAMVGALIAGAVIGGAVYLFYQAMIAEQQSRNQTLSTEIAKLDEQIKEISTLQSEIDALAARQKAVEDLQSDRNLPVHMLNELVQFTPEGVYLTGLKQDNLAVTLQGMAQSNERVSDLLRRLGNESKWVRSPELVEIAAKSINLTPKDQRRVYAFSVRALLARPSALAASAASGASAAAPAAMAAASAAVQ